MIFAFSSILIALSFAAPNSAPSDITCSTARPPITPSVAAPALSVTFHNDFGVPVELCWSNFQGGLNSYGTIQPNGDSAINTFEGHIWSVRAPGYTPCSGKPLSGYGSFCTAGAKSLQALASKCPSTAY